MHRLRRFLTLISGRSTPTDAPRIAREQAVALLNDVNAVLVEADLSAHARASQGALRRLRRAKQRAHQIRPPAGGETLRLTLIAMLRTQEAVMQRMIEGDTQDRTVLDHADQKALEFKLALGDIQRSIGD